MSESFRADMTNKSCILLDLDGTLADSLGVMRTVYAEFLTSQGKRPSDGEFETLNGPPLPEVVRRLKDDHDLAEPVERLLADYQKQIDTAYGEVSPTPGARELLSRVQAIGWQAGVVTSNSAVRTRSWLASADLLSLIAVIVTGEDVPYGKPDPAPYRAALALAGCDARETVAVEDSPQGARAALDAGIDTFGLASAAGGEIDWPPGITVVGSLADIDLPMERRA